VDSEPVEDGSDQTHNGNGDRGMTRQLHLRMIADVAAFADGPKAGFSSSDPTLVAASKGEQPLPGMSNVQPPGPEEDLTTIMAGKNGKKLVRFNPCVEWRGVVCLRDDEVTSFFGRDCSDLEVQDDGGDDADDDDDDGEEGGGEDGDGGEDGGEDEDEDEEDDNDNALTVTCLILPAVNSD
jgi:hypothetical protein